MKPGKKILIGSLIALPFVMMSCFGHHHMHCSDRSADSILGRLDSRVEDLDLTTEQQSRYRGIREKVHQDLLKGLQHRREGYTILEKGFQSEKPDIASIADELRNHIKNRPEVMLQQLEHFEEFYSLLNESQKNKLVEEIRDKIEDYPCRDD